MAVQISERVSCPRCLRNVAVTHLEALATCGACGLQWKAEPAEARGPARRGGQVRQGAAA